MLLLTRFARSAATNKQALNRTVNNLEAAFHFVAVVEEREMLSNNNDK